MFPRKQRQVKVDAVLKEDIKASYRNDNELPNDNSPSLTAVDAIEANTYAVTDDDTRLLTPEETFTYFKNNFVALDGLARDYVYRSEHQDSDDVNTVKTNYEALADSVKAGYRAKALGKAKDLAQTGQVALLLPVNQIAEINSVANNDLSSYVITKDGDTVTETYTDDDGVETTYSNSAV